MSYREQSAPDPSRTPIEAVEQSLCTRFEEQAKRFAERTAILVPDGSWSYAQLDAWANSIAHGIFRMLGPGKEPVCIHLPQGALNVAATLGILKTGRPFVPVEPSQSATALLVTLRATASPLLLCEEVSQRTIEGLVGDLTCVMAVEPSHHGEGSGRLPVTVDVDDLACIFFTSGTTGSPKGVMDSHRNVRHNVLRYTETLGIGPSDRLTMIQSPVFSGAVSSLFGALLNGASLLPYDLRSAGLVGLSEWVQRSRATIYHSVPSIFRAVVDAGRSFPDVRVVRLEGDAADTKDLDLFRQACGPKAVLAHGLGCTETGLIRQARIHRDTVYAVGRLPIGGPVPDVEMRMVDESGREVPRGAIGEIEVRSAYLAKGYWQNDDLTAQRFLIDPADPERRIYRTGDLGVMAKDGSVSLLGRKDRIFKVHGQWVDPQRVEQALLALGHFSEVVVIANAANPSAPPIAYLVARPEAKWGRLELRSALEATLEPHMVPGAFHSIPAIPLTPHGKLDHSALPEEACSHGPPIAYSSDHERTMAGIWEDVLGVGPVGPNDHFFLLGGDSLSAAIVAAKAERAFSLPIKADDLLRKPVLHALVQWIEARGFEVPANGSHANKMPIFCIDWPGGNGWELAGLAHLLSADRAFHTIPSCGMMEPWPQDTSIRRMAEACLARIRAVHPTGAFVLAGNCYGGVVALEAAHLLGQRGGSSPRVLLFQVGPRDFPTVITSEELRRCLRNERQRRHNAQWSELRRRPLLDRLVELKKILLRKVMLVHIRALGRLSRSLVDGPESELPMHLLAHFALREHRPARFEGHVSMFLPEEAVSAYTSNVQKTWAGLATAVRIHILPGSKDTVLSATDTERVARLVRNDLEEVG